MRIWEVPFHHRRQQHIAHTHPQHGHHAPDEELGEVVRKRADEVPGHHRGAGQHHADFQPEAPGNGRAGQSTGGEQQRREHADDAEGKVVQGQVVTDPAEDRRHGSDCRAQIQCDEDDAGEGQDAAGP